MRNLKAIIYLHLLRTWRYKLSFINSTLNITLWMSIFILGAILFVPKNLLPQTAPVIFWGILIWNILSSSVWYIAGWTIWFLISTGLIEEHYLHGVGMLRFLSGRLITITIQVAMATPLVYVLLLYAAKTSFPLVSSASYLLLGILCFTMISLSYALILSVIAMRTSVPGPLLDFSNILFFVIGGIAVPLANLYEPIRIIALFTPFSHPAEIVRYGAIGIVPYIGLEREVLITVFLALFLFSVAVIIFRKVEQDYLRKHGIKGIGRM